MLYFSSLIGAKVLDNANTHIGSLSDVVVRISQTYPKLEALVVNGRKGKTPLHIPYEEVELIGKGIVTLKKSSTALPEYKLSEHDMYLRDTVLDRQVIDSEGLKVVRANDIVFGKVQGELTVVSIDVSFAAILRRLGLGGIPLISSLTPDLVTWNGVTLVDTAMPQLQLKSDEFYLHRLHPADVANLVEELNAKRGAVLVSHLQPDVAAEVLEEMDEEDQVALIEHLSAAKAGDILEDMSPDEAADILSELPEEKAQKIIAELEPEEGQKILELAEYDNAEAGGLMTTDYLEVQPDWTVKMVKKKMRETAEEIPTITYIYVTEPDGHLVGVLSLRTLSTSGDHDRIKNIMSTNVFTVDPNARIKEIAHYLTKYNLFSIAVVDHHKHLMGIVQVDDVMRELFPGA